MECCWNVTVKPLECHWNAIGMRLQHDWNKVRVKCVGKHPKIITWINGEKVCEFDAASYSGSGFDREKITQTLGTKGSIAVQVHGGGGWPKGAKCRWRNIRIKEL